MRSATSFFNGPLYRKNMARFWPVWALYGLIWMLLIPLSLLSQAARAHRFYDQPLEHMLQQARAIPDLLQGGVWLGAFFGVLCAMAVFGYLCSSRSACMMHALPPRRECLFLTNYLTGLSFLLLPHLAVFLLALGVEALGGYLAVPQLWLWLWAQSAVCLFFYSFAAFCAMFTGHILALPAFYGVLNALAFVMVSLMNEVLRSFLYGYAGLSSAVENAALWLTPLYQLSLACEAFAALQTDGSYRTVLMEPGTVGIYAAAGVLLAVAALLLYRHRQVESAGDVVAVPIVRPLFRYGVALCAGLCLGVFTTLILSLSSREALAAMILIWAVAGYFVAEMLLRKSFRVLRAWKGAVALAAALALLLAGARLDVTGYQKRVPALEEIRTLTLSGLAGAPYDTARNSTVVLEAGSPLLEKALALHQAVADHPEDWWDDSGAWDDSARVELTYQLENGSALNRSYYLHLFLSDLEREGSVTWAAQRLLDDPAYSQALYDLDAYAQDRVLDASLDGLWDAQEQGFTSLFLSLSPTELAQLWEAMTQDLRQGNLGRRYLFEYSQERGENTYRTDLVFTLVGTDARGDEVYRNFSVTLTPQARATLDWLAEHGCLDERYQVRRNGWAEDDLPDYPDTYSYDSPSSAYDTAAAAALN